MVIACALIAVECESDELFANDTMSVSEIRSHVATLCRSVRSLYYEAEIIGRVLETPEGEHRTVCRRFGAMDGFRYEQVMHQMPGLELEDDVNATNTWMRPGSVDILWSMDRLCRHSATVTTARENPKLRDVEFDFYMRCTGWWPQHEAKRDDWFAEEPQTSIRVLLENPNLVVRSKPEPMHNHLCTVAEIRDKGFINVLWFSNNLPGAVIQRVQVDLHRNIRIMSANREFISPMPGIWLPMRIKRSVTYTGSSSAESVSRTLYLSESDMKISRLVVNSLGAEFFEPKCPPGTITVDTDNQRVTVKPGGVDMLDDVARVASGLMKAKVAAKPTNIIDPEMLVVIVCGAAIGIAYGVVYRTPVTIVRFRCK